MFAVQSDLSASGTGRVFNARTKAPSLSNPYYKIRGDSGGYSTCILIDKSTGSTLPNCVGYAIGRFNEIMGNTTENWVSFPGNASQLVESAQARNWPISRKPSLGALAVFTKIGGAVLTTAGHVAVVEDIESDTVVWLSESNYGATPGTTGAPLTGKAFGYGRRDLSSYSGVYYIVNPAVVGGNYTINTEALQGEAFDIYGGPYNQDTYSNHVWPSLKGKQTVQNSKTYTEVETQIVKSELKTAGANDKFQGKNLLSYPALVETPFIILQVGEYTFGSVNKEKLNNSTLKVTYPNYMKSLSVTKVNGTVNQYNINLEYQIKAGDDPNLLDKVFSSVGYGKVYISYGDWSTPTYLYKQEEALVTKLTSRVDFANSRINYTLTCTSSAISVMGGNMDFPAQTDKPSNIIKNLLINDVNGIRTKIFTGMNSTNIHQLICNDDKPVSIQPKSNIDILSYIEYLVSCMTSNTNRPGEIIKNSNYYLTIHDAVQTDQEFLVDDINTISNSDTTTIIYKAADGTKKKEVYNLVKADSYTRSINGPYFKITKVDTNLNIINNTSTYEIDVGFPGEPGSDQQNLVLNFDIVNDNSWALLYNYSNEKVNLQDNYIYKIDNDGNLTGSVINKIATNNKYQSSEDQNSWWTKMTQFPINATITLKGLVRPAVLMSYVRINALFYGQKHVSSGLYIITKQQDTVDSRGYRTVLSLTRIAGERDYFEDSIETVKTRVVKYN